MSDPPNPPPWWWPWPNWNPWDDTWYPGQPLTKWPPWEKPPGVPQPPFPSPYDPTVPWAFPGHPHGNYWDYPDPYGTGSGSGKKKKRKGKGKGRSRKGPRMPRSKRPKKPKMIRLRSSGTAGRSGSSGTGVYKQSSANGGAMGLLDLSGVQEGLAGVVLELVGEGNVTLGHALTVWQQEQERVTNRVWRRPGGLAAVSGL